MGESVKSATPHIERRDIHFDVADHLTPTWLMSNHYITAFCDALSMLFPHGERFFIKSVNAYAAKLTDPVLKEQVREFIAQEALHTREHEAYNQALAERGCDRELMEGRVRDALNRTRVPARCLAVTVGIEHLTAIFAHMILRDPSLFEDAPEPLRDLWTWHCLEEMEHKGVAFDVYQAVTADWPAWKRYVLRCAAMISATRGILAVQNANILTILEQRGYSTGGFLPLRSLWMKFVWPGYYRRALPHYLRYYLPGFHPWQAREVKAAASWRTHFKAKMERKA